MADAVTDVAKLNGWFKTKHGQFQDLVTPNAKLYGMLGSLVKAQQVGRDFRFPVELSLPQGVTYAAAGSGAFAFEDTVPGEMKEATIDGAQVVVSDILDYESAAKATAEGSEAYGDAGERLIRRIKKAGQKRLELSFWYGQTNLGTVESITGSGGTRVLQMSTASWAGGIWTGMKGMKLDAWDTSAFGAAPTNPDAEIIVTAVDVKNRKLSVSGDTSDLTALDTPAAAGTAVLTPYNARTNDTTSQDCAGVDKIVTNTGSLFGINASTYELWAGNTFSAGSQAFSLRKLNDAIADAVSKGLDEKAVVFVNPRTWANLCSDQAAMRKYDAQYTESKAKNGFRSLTMFSQNGELEIVPHTVVKEGEAWILPVERFLKIGAQDLGFNVPGRGEQYFDNAVNSSGRSLAGYRLMAYAHVALICGAPGLCTKVTDIVNA